LSAQTSYQLLLTVRETLQIKVGKLGVFTIPAGYYIYTGSAKKNMQARIARHRRKDKPLHWHIDYLTSHAQIEISAVRFFDEEECQLNQKQSGRVLIPGFGASDCRSGCVSHLKYLGDSAEMWKS